MQLELRQANQRGGVRNKAKSPSPRGRRAAAEVNVRLESLTDRQLDILLERILARQTGSYGSVEEGPSKH